MLAAELINNNIPRIQLQDTIREVLQLMNDFKLTHLPIVADEKYIGLIGEENLLDADDTKAIESMQDKFMNVFVYEKEHFLNAVKYSTQYNTNVVPVVNEKKELQGTITSNELVKALGNFAGTNEIGGIIVLEMERNQFAISEISRIVESNDSTILHLNTTVHPQTGMLTVTLHLNKKEISTIVSTFERYEYEVLYYFGNESFENEIHRNYRNLMYYLDI